KPAVSTVRRRESSGGNHRRRLRALRRRFRPCQNGHGFNGHQCNDCRGTGHYQYRHIKRESNRMREQDQLAQLKLTKMRRIATGLLLLMAAVFVGAKLLQPNYGYLSFVSAFAEAAM